MKLFIHLARLALGGLGISLLFCGALAASAEPAVPQGEFNQALAQYRAGRFAAAYGAFSRMADAGDAESARIALVLLRHGEKLNGGIWSASQPQITRWIRLARQPMAPLVTESGD